MDLCFRALSCSTSCFVVCVTTSSPTPQQAGGQLARLRRARRAAGSAVRRGSFFPNVCGFFPRCFFAKHSRLNIPLHSDTVAFSLHTCNNMYMYMYMCMCIHASASASAFERIHNVFARLDASFKVCTHMHSCRVLKTTPKECNVS